MHDDVTIAVIGAGIRGSSHAKRVERTGNAQIIAVAEPRADRRQRFAQDHRLRPEQAFSDWRALAEARCQPDAVVITTQDALHMEPAECFAELGCHIMLEKPMAPTEPESLRIVEAVEQAGVILAVCHVLRYSAYTRALKAHLDSGRIGEIVSVQHLEPVGWWHFAHSYVRGNWRREDESSCLLMAKCCHDLDWLGYIIGRRARRVASFGNLTHFRRENRPEGATARCVDCPVEITCPYSAPRLYQGCLGDPRREHWPFGAVSDVATEQALAVALRSGPYGRCVYTCDNDVVDHQVVILEYDGGLTATHTVTAFTEMAGRKTRIFGTRGSIEGDGNRLVLHDFLADRSETIFPVEAQIAQSKDSHGGGDQALVDAFVTAVKANDPAFILSGPRESLDSHRIVWAAERARLTGSVISVQAEA